MSKILIAALALAWALGGPAYAQQGNPTGVCKDGSNYYGASKSGACSHHGGVKEWYGAGGAAAAPAATAPAAAASGSSSAPASSAQQGSPTGLCKDGSNYYGASKSGACSHHGGVKEWYGAGGAAAAAPATAASASHSAPAATTAAPAPVAPTAAAAPRTSSPSPTSSGSGTAQAPGGGPGLVWVNTASKVYHCNGTRYYGKTKQGKYVTEAEAKSEGDRPDHGKPCS
jgi:hypothetical protein